jgi:hypothetical protein
MTSYEKSNEWWDVFIGNHFVCRVAASSKTEALETGLRLHGAYLDGILNVRPRGQQRKAGGHDLSESHLRSQLPA